MKPIIIFSKIRQTSKNVFFCIEKLLYETESNLFGKSKKFKAEYFKLHILRSRNLHEFGNVGSFHDFKWHI